MSLVTHSTKSSVNIRSNFSSLSALSKKISKNVIIKEVSRKKFRVELNFSNLKTGYNIKKGS